MISKLIHLAMDYETFDQLSALEQVRVIFRPLQTSMKELFAKIG